MNSSWRVLKINKNKTESNNFTFWIIKILSRHLELFEHDLMSKCAVDSFWVFKIWTCFHRGATQMGWSLGRVSGFRKDVAQCLEGSEVILNPLFRSFYWKSFSCCSFARKAPSKVFRLTARMLDTLKDILGEKKYCYSLQYNFYANIEIESNLPPNKNIPFSVSFLNTFTLLRTFLSRDSPSIPSPTLGSSQVVKVAQPTIAFGLVLRIFKQRLFHAN